MPQLQLHADYDRDGRLSRSQEEYALRHNRPGAIIVPNLDCDGAGVLPSTATDRPLPTLDCARPTKVLRDDDLTTIAIRILERPREGRVILKMRGYNSKAVNLCDARGHVMRPQRNIHTIIESEAGRATTEYFLNLPHRVNEIRYKLEATRCIGSPLSHRRGLNEQIIRRFRDQELIRIEVIWEDTGGDRTVCDWGYFTIAPIIFIDNTCQAQRLYMVEGVPRYDNGPCENEPSLRGVREALPPHVDFVRVSYITGFSDTWIQDQFQLGYVQGAGRNHWMHLLLHLPRKKRNVIDDFDADSTITNLSDFVNCHFPARNVGVFRDFISNERNIVFYGDIRYGQRSQALNFEQSHAVYQVLQAALSVRYLILDEISRLGGTTDNDLPSHFGEAFDSINRLWSSLRRAIERRQEAPESSSYLIDHLNRLRDVFALLIDGVFDTITSTSDGETFTLNFSNMSLRFDRNQLDNIYRRLVRTFHRINFGGNLEISPPVEGAPLGKIVFGTDASIEGHPQFDANLLHFFYSQKEQPVVFVDVGWLSSRHVDDILAFIPNPRRVEGQSFAIVRAAPGIGVQLIEAAKRRYIQGLDRSNDLDLGDLTMHTERGTVNWPLFASQRFTRRGLSPVTHMMRGKRWLYQHATGSLSSIVPPRIYHYLAYADIYEQGRRDRPPLIPLRPGMGEDRYYRAGISVFEFSDYENGSNRFIETNYMTALDELLGNEFPNIPIIFLPVLFDAMDQTFTEDSQNAWPHSSTASSADTTGAENPQESEASDEEIYSLRTSAFIPNSINMQVVDNTLIIPRPYGPRMSVPDTIHVLREVLTEQDLQHLTGFLSERFFTSKGLIGVWHWVGVMGETSRRPSDLSRNFVDGFPDSDLVEITARIEDHPRNREVFEWHTEEREVLSLDDDDPLAGVFDPLEMERVMSYRVRGGCQEIFIPEPTVDLFEAYVQVVLEPLGVSIRWVDSWYYHVRFGGLHCATNALRVPRMATAGAPPWWYSVVEMEEELV